jgi:hypothetical protein
MGVNRGVGGVAIWAQKVSVMRISRILFLIVLAAIAIAGYYTIRVTSLLFLQYNKFHPPHEQIHRPEERSIQVFMISQSK